MCAHDEPAVAGVWPLPPEVPRPPDRPPGQPPAPAPVPRPAGPTLPSWFEPDPELTRQLTDRLLEHRVVLASGHLDAALADRVAAQLLLLARQGEEAVELQLACPTSDLDAALGLADVVDMLSVPVRAVVRGTLGGPVLAVLAAARERVASRRAVLVLSVPRAPAHEGRGEDARLAAEQLEHQLAVLRDRLAAATGRAPDDVATDLRAGLVLGAEEAVAYGLVQHVT